MVLALTIVDVPLTRPSSVIFNVADVNVPLTVVIFQFLALSKALIVAPLSTVVAPVSAIVTRTTGEPVATTDCKIIGR